MSIRPALILCAMAATAACGAGNVTRAPVVSAPTTPITNPVIAPPTAPAFSAADFNVAVADDERAASLAETPSSVIPFGRATYDGTVRSGARINDDGGYDIIGDLTLDVDINSRSSFANRNPISGTITDLTVIDRERDDRATALIGTLDIDGDSTLGEIEATATGSLARERDGRDDEADWAIDLDGSFRDDFARADTITGTVNGGTTGGNRDDYDVDLTGTGRFVAIER